MTDTSSFLTDPTVLQRFVQDLKEAFAQLHVRGKESFYTDLANGEMVFEKNFQEAFNRLEETWKNSSTSTTEKCIGIIELVERIRSGEHPAFPSFRNDSPTIIDDEKIVNLRDHQQTTRVHPQADSYCRNIDALHRQAKINFVTYYALAHSKTETGHSFDSLYELVMEGRQQFVEELQKFEDDSIAKIEDIFSFSMSEGTRERYARKCLNNCKAWLIIQGEHPHEAVDAVLNDLDDISAYYGYDNYNLDLQNVETVLAKLTVGEGYSAPTPRARQREVNAPDDVVVALPWCNIAPQKCDL